MQCPREASRKYLAQKSSSDLLLMSIADSTVFSNRKVDVLISWATKTYAIKMIWQNSNEFVITHLGFFWLVFFLFVCLVFLACGSHIEWNFRKRVDLPQHRLNKLQRTDSMLACLIYFTVKYCIKKNIQRLPLEYWVIINSAKIITMQIGLHFRRQK